LTRVNEVETTLNEYIGNLSKTVNDVKAGVANIRIPAIDVDAVSYIVAHLPLPFTFHCCCSSSAGTWSR